MTLDIFFLLLVTTYLVLIAYGVVGTRRRRLGARVRGISAGLIVVLPPALIALMLLVAGEGALVGQWGRLFVAMALAGTMVAVVADRVARRVAG